MKTLEKPLQEVAVNLTVGLEGVNPANAAPNPPKPKPPWAQALHFGRLRRRHRPGSRGDNRWLAQVVSRTGKGMKTSHTVEDGRP
jgi:hypothetical protein